MSHKSLNKYLNHLNSTGALKQLSELSAIHIERKVTDEEFQVSGERASATRRGWRGIVVAVGEHVFLLNLEIRRYGDVSGETRGVLGGGGASDGGGGSEDGVEFEGEGRWEDGGGAGDAEREGFRVEGR